MRHLECPEKRANLGTADLRKEALEGQEGAIGDKWLAGCVTLRPKRSFADLQI